jgi:serine/threonine protein kinase/Rieske Fe-S protein
MQRTLVDQLIGQNIGMYQVEQLLGRGRINAVFLARHPAHKNPVALTTFIVPDQFPPESRQRFHQRFRKEATRLTALRHPHLLPVYDYGEHLGHPYLVTSYMANGSLADLLKRRGRLHHAEVLNVLQPVVAGLTYAQERGLVHGTLKPSHIVLSSQSQILVAGFGLKTILQMRGIGADERSYGHLLSIIGTFLTPAEYVAPEVVQGQQEDARSDIYSVGTILFEMLTGKPPFTGKNPLEVARQHVQQRVPSLRTLCPDIPLALAAVVNQALDRDPARRFQHVSELGEAFAQVSTALPGNTPKHAIPTIEAFSHGRQTELQETPAEGHTIGNWQLLPPIVTGKLAAVEKAPPTLVPTSQEPLPSVPLPAPEPGSVAVERNQPSAPYDWRTASPQGPLPLRRVDSSGWSAGPTELRPASHQRARLPAKRQTHGDDRITRRRVIALLAGAGVTTAGTVIVANLRQSMAGNTPSQQMQPGTNGAASTSRVQQTMPTGNMGTMIGSTNLAKNTAMDFVNPVDGKASILIHLSNGNFVAYEKACTHVGVYVNYVPATRLLVCPAHGAIFDPAQGGAVLQGPAARPLPKVIIHVNTDGMITV